MTATQFKRTRMKAFIPRFKDLAHLQALDDGRTLRSFLDLLHPDSPKWVKGGEGAVIDKQYSFRLYRTGILRTDTDGNLRFYPYYTQP